LCLIDSEMGLLQIFTHVGMVDHGLHDQRGKWSLEM
jgi:hypothetical protein